MSAFVIDIHRAKFPLGQLAITPGAEEIGQARLQECLELHAAGDWGCVDAEDKRSNDEALRDGSRVLSAYPIDPAKPSRGHGANTLWVISEADRSVTTFLLPEEY